MSDTFEAANIYKDNRDRTISMQEADSFALAAVERHIVQDSSSEEDTYGKKARRDQACHITSRCSAEAR
jgi:Tfp pilus assembly protein PilX